MASSVTAQSVLEKISVDHLECSICTNRFRQPKLLDCLHSFCLQCLQELRQSQDPSGTKLTCPLCRRETMLKGSGVADLLNNFAFSALVEEVTMQEKLLEGQESEIKCQACDEENQAISRCIDCDHFLCQECQKAHGRMTVMKSHKIYTLAQLRSGEIVYKSKEVPKCGKHPDQNLNVYCNLCEQVICTTCSVLDHAKHSLIGLPEAFDECKEKVQELIVKIEKSKTELYTIIQELCESRKELDTMYATTKTKISKKALQEIAKIRQEEEKLSKETDRIYKERVKDFETAGANNRKEVTKTEHKMAEMKHLTDPLSSYEILELQPKLLHNLSAELTGKQPHRVPKELTFMDFEEGEWSLGSLVLEQEAKSAAQQSLRRGRCVQYKWELKTVINQFIIRLHIQQVSALSNNKILAFDSGNRALFAVISPKCQHERSCPKRIPINDFTNVRRYAVRQDGEISVVNVITVRCIAVSKYDEILVLDGPVVKVFNKQHQLLHQFTPDRGSAIQPTCLAVDDSNLIAVGYEGKDEISLHNPDGSLIRRLPAPMLAHNLVIFDHRLIYINYSQQRLLSVDYHGASVFSIDIRSDGGKDAYPNSVCCDRDGSMYVALEGVGSSDILHYTPDGKYNGLAINGCHLTSSITFSSAGDLVVAGVNSVRIYHRV